MGAPDGGGLRRGGSTNGNGPGSRLSDGARSGGSTRGRGRTRSGRSADGGGLRSWLSYGLGDRLRCRLGCRSCARSRLGGASEQ